MSDALLQLDDEILEVLNDIARDPKSTLFNALPPKAVTSPLIDVPTLSAGTAGWTPSERHLLKAYREQVAWALGCLVIERSRRDQSVTLMNIDQQQIALTSEENLQRAVGALASSDPTVASYDILSACVSGLPFHQITEFLRSIRPNDRSRNLHGWALMLDGEYSAAEQELHAVASSSLCSDSRYYAMVNLNYCSYAQGRLAEALGHQLAALKEAHSPTQLASAMINAHTLGRPDIVAACATELDQTWSAAHAGIKRLCEILAVRRDPGEASKSAIPSPLGSVSAEVFHAAFG